LSIQEEFTPIHGGVGSCYCTLCEHR